MGSRRPREGPNGRNPRGRLQMSRQYYTIAAVAKLLACSEGHVRNAIKAGHLRAIQLRGKGRGTYRISEDALRDYEERSQVLPRPKSQNLTPRVKFARPKHLRLDPAEDDGPGPGPG